MISRWSITLYQPWCLQGLRIFWSFLRQQTRHVLKSCSAMVHNLALSCHTRCNLVQMVWLKPLLWARTSSTANLVPWFWATTFSTAMVLPNCLSKLLMMHVMAEQRSLVIMSTIQNVSAWLILTKTSRQFQSKKSQNILRAITLLLACTSTQLVLVKRPLRLSQVHVAKLKLPVWTICTFKKATWMFNFLAVAMPGLILVRCKV